MNTYKHKTLGWIANYDDTLNGIYRIKDKEAYNYIDKQLIENSQDREEVVEKDWIDDAWCNFCNNSNGYIEEDSRKMKLEFTKTIEKYTPKPKIFTMYEVIKWNEDKQTFAGNAICNFLKEHNLLSSDE